MKKHLKLTLHGDVRHTGVRFSIMQKAYQLAITGNATYSDNGKKLIIHAEGNDLPLKTFIEYCSRGLFELNIEKQDVEELPPENFPSFDLIG